MQDAQTLTVARQQRDSSLGCISDSSSNVSELDEVEACRAMVPIMMAVPSEDPELPDEVVPASMVCADGLRASLGAPTLAQASLKSPPSAQETDVSQRPHSQLSPAASSAPTDGTTSSAPDGTISSAPTFWGFNSWTVNMRSSAPTDETTSSAPDKTTSSALDETISLAPTGETTSSALDETISSAPTDETTSLAPTDETTPSIPQLTTATATVEQLTTTSAEEDCKKPCFGGGCASRPPRTVSSEAPAEQRTLATATAEQLTATPAEGHIEEDCDKPCFGGGRASRPPRTGAGSLEAPAEQLTATPAEGHIEEDCEKPCFGAGRARRRLGAGSGSLEAPAEQRTTATASVAQLTATPAEGHIKDECTKPCFGGGRARRSTRSKSKSRRVK
jgi:hypothetical protein